MGFARLAGTGLKFRNAFWCLDEHSYPWRCSYYFLVDIDFIPIVGSILSSCGESCLQCLALTQQRTGIVTFAECSSCQYDSFLLQVQQRWLGLKNPHSGHFYDPVKQVVSGLILMLGNKMFWLSMTDISSIFFEECKKPLIHATYRVKTNVYRVLLHPVHYDLELCVWIQEGQGLQGIKMWLPKLCITAFAGKTTDIRWCCLKEVNCADSQLRM